MTLSLKKYLSAGAFALVMAFTGFGQNNAKTVDSAAVYLAKKWPFKKTFEFVYRYCVAVSDDDADYTIKYGRRLFDLSATNHDTMAMAKANYLIGYGYATKENYVLAIDYFFKALPATEMHKDTSLLMNIYNTIGISYSQQKQHKKAAEYFKKVGDLAEILGSWFTVAISYNNLGIEYQRLKQYTISDSYLKKAYKLFSDHDNPQYLPTILMNMGVIRFEKGMYDSALFIYRKAQKFNATYNKEAFTPSIANNLGEIFFKLNQLDSSLYYLNISLNLIDTLNDRYSTRELYMHLSNVYNAKGNSAKAYYYLKKHNHVNSIIFNDENLKRSLAAEANFEVVKQENKVKLLEQQQQFDKHRNSLIYIFGAIVGVLLIIALVIVIFRFREKKKANDILTEQKNKIELQQKEITDSINYAKRIQHSILPADSYLEEILKDYILYYQPKDIVGGDFYFVQKVDNRTYFSAIDCTGHGVPGGFMSLLGYNGLQNAILDLKIKAPGKILDCLSENLVSHFTQEGKQTLRDGMDMALCCLYEENGKKILEFAGANNPCWIVRKKDNELIEINPNKQPIGYFEANIPFTNFKLTVEPGDMIYLFSDGYADQFGGPNGKKFKYTQFKSILLQTPHISLKEREQLIKSAFTEWMGTYEQIDDVCILGVRV